MCHGTEASHESPASWCRPPRAVLNVGNCDLPVGRGRAGAGSQRGATMGAVDPGPGRIAVNPDGLLICGGLSMAAVSGRGRCLRGPRAGSRRGQSVQERAASMSKAGGHEKVRDGQLAPRGGHQNSRCAVVPNTCPSLRRRRCSAQVTAVWAAVLRTARARCSGNCRGGPVQRRLHLMAYTNY